MTARLIGWTLFGLTGCATFIVCALTDHWPGFAVGIFMTCATILFLGSGVWRRWPR